MINPAQRPLKQFRGYALGQEQVQRAEGLGRPGLAAAAVKARTGQRDGAEGRTEPGPARRLAQQQAAAEITTPMPRQKTCRLGAYHAFLDADQYGLGVGE